MAIHIGCSGWSYDHWQGIVYPQGASSEMRLACYTERFTTVEVNSSYYHWPRDQTFVNWHARVPDGFVMTIKAPRGLTHASRLQSPEVWIARVSRGLSELKEKRGVFLLQLPPKFAYDYDLLAHFLEQMPDWIRLAVEFRHESWHRDEIFDILAQHGAAYCIMSGAHLPCILRTTAPFVYVRLHGPDPHSLYAGSYSDQDLRWWADRIREWDGQGRDVYVYFNNDGYGYAVYNAETLKHLLGA